jgi:mannose-6-phosphate isomerase class I
VTGSSLRAYDPFPFYEPVNGVVLCGWTTLADHAARTRRLAVDGPEIAPWDELVSQLRRRLGQRGVAVRTLDARDGMASWETIVASTSSTELADDPDFETMADASLEELFQRPVQAEGGTDAVTVIFGPGAALSAHDELWYFDQPKRYAEAAIAAGAGRNLGQRDMPGNPTLDNPTARRLFYVDWPILDRHRETIAARVSLWIDAQDADRPTALAAPTLAATAAALVRRPFRTRPVFNTTVWGGHWGQRQLGMGTDQPNSAVGYELIAPESGVLIGSQAELAVEVPFQLLVWLHPMEVLGESVHERFGTSFPIRFDYLDTVDGGNLSVHCHPQAQYMREVFGWPYTQHESYYVMVTGPHSRIYLGLREDADIDVFQADAKQAEEAGRAFDIRRHVQTFPAVAHQLYLVPAGTPHGSGVGNVVLEVSATPYLYSLRFYDWLRQDSKGLPRAVHTDLAFQNLDRQRRGRQVSTDLIPAPRQVRSGQGWREVVLGELSEMFFEVRRLELDPDSEAPEDTAGRFHVLNVVEGAGITITITSTDATAGLAYAETVVVPASVGAYTVKAWEPETVRVMKAYVR